WDLAREMFLLMADRYPLHPRTAEAYRWLIKHNTSSEARRRHELGQFLIVSNLSILPPRDKLKPAGFQESKSGALVAPDVMLPGGPEVVQKTQFLPLRDLEAARLWYRASEEFGERYAKFGPLYAADPAVEFCLQAARRRLGQFKEVQERY